MTENRYPDNSVPNNRTVKDSIYNSGKFRLSSDKDASNAIPVVLYIEDAPVSDAESQRKEVDWDKVKRNAALAGYGTTVALGKGLSFIGNRLKKTADKHR